MEICSHKTVVTCYNKLRQNFDINVAAIDWQHRWLSSTFKELGREFRGQDWLWLL